MIRIARPSEEEIAAMLRDEGAAFGHEEVGATADPRALERLSNRYAVDRHRFTIGQGHEAFERARAALLSWRHFEIPWLALHGANEPVHVGQRVATRTRVAGLWFVNPCRVVYLERGDDTSGHVAFAYGTLAGHVACGEERFGVRRDPVSDAVEFEIVAFSRPAMALTRIGRPLLRRIQRRFAADSARALSRASLPKRAAD